MKPENTSSLFKHLECSACGSIYSGRTPLSVCADPNCAAPLFCRYHIPYETDNLFSSRSDMWRYQALLPVLDGNHIISLGEGMSPLLPFENLAYYFTENTLYWKDESNNPTGSFKARGLSAALSKARELGISEVSIPTAGNAGGALAAYAARGNMKAHVFMPKRTPETFKKECLLYGAEVLEIDGNISDCGKAAATASQQHGWFDISTLKEPYRVEGKKTMGFEIAEQFNFQLPDVILYPTGGGTGLIGIWKAFEELERMNWLDSKRPRLVAVQSDACNGIVEAIRQNQHDAQYTDHGYTIANGLRVPKAYASRIILENIRASKGTAVSISDPEIAISLAEIAAREGMLIAPEGAALWAAFKKLHDQSWISPGEKVLFLNTGNGYKYLDNIPITNIVNHSSLLRA